MKSLFEIQYEKMIIASISERTCDTKKQADFFHDFYKHGSTYYEELCEILYFMSSGERMGTLYITPVGRPYISYGKWNKEDMKMFSSFELPCFKEDLYDQLIFFFSRLATVEKPGGHENFMIDFGSTM